MPEGKSLKRLLWVVLLLLGAAVPAIAAITNINPTQIPLSLLSAEVTVESYGGVAETSVKMTFYNPNPWQVGAEVDFRLAGGCTLTGFAINMPDGTMKEGIPINMLQRRFFFSDLSEVGRDASMIEMLRDGSHKIRVFPVEAKQSRTIELRHVGNLRTAGENGNDFFYNLPLAWGLEEVSLSQPSFEVERPKIFFAFRMNVHGSEGTPYARDKNGEKLFFTKSGCVHTFEYIFDPQAKEEYDAVFDTAVDVIVPGAGNTGSLVQSTDTGKYFYMTVGSGQLASLMRSSDVPPPSKIGIAWDSSLSGRLRNSARELEFLDAYFNRLLKDDGVPEIRVSLLRFRNDVEKIEEFVVDGKSGWEQLRRALVSVVYDGATNFCAVRSEMKLPVDEWLLFSGGHENYGLHSEWQKSPVVHTIASKITAYAPTLRQFASANGGVFVDLSSTSAEKAADLLRRPRVWLSRIDGEGVEDVLVDSRTIGREGMMVLGGRLTEKDGSVKLTFEGQGKDKPVAVLNIPVKGNSPVSPLAAREWGRMKIDELLSEHVAVDALTVQRMGREFGIVSFLTSIVIPSEGMSSIVGDFSPESPVLNLHAGVSSGGVAPEEAVKEYAYPLDLLKKEWAEMLDLMRKPGDMPLLVSRTGSSGPFRGVARKHLWAEASMGEGTSSFIPYGDGAHYLERLRSVPVQKAYEIYLAELPRYWRVPDFFLDTSDVLFEYGLSDLGLRVLSNLVEIDAENKWLLRTLGYRLVELGSPQARVMFDKIVKMDVDDPQSYRDLAFECAGNGDVDRAVELLYFVATHTWSNDFNGVQLAALRDMNAIIGNYGSKFDPTRVDPALLDFVPIDIRVMWTADRFDADLQVRLSDADGNPVERGALALDYAPGNGADEVVVPRAKSGKYVVKVGYADERPREERIPTLALITLVTNIGTKMQSEKTVTVRLVPDQEGMRTAMEFTFDAEQTARHTEANKAESEGERNMKIVFALLAVAGIAALVSVMPRRR